jgi:uncharacterized OB-fold protein
VTKLPDCPRCDSATPLEKIRADGKGQIWTYCNSCSASVLVGPAGNILHASAK